MKKNTKNHSLPDDGARRCPSLDVLRRGDLPNDIHPGRGLGGARHAGAGYSPCGARCTSGVMSCKYCHHQCT